MMATSNSYVSHHHSLAPPPSSLHHHHQVQQQHAQHPYAQARQQVSYAHRRQSSVSPSSSSSSPTEHSAMHSQQYHNLQGHNHYSPYQHHHHPNNNATSQWPSSVRRALPPYSTSNETSSVSTSLMDANPPSSSTPSNTAAQPVLMVATGKKRKRLQRACVACHKAKRRCDGGLPCSNCDFSGRTCAYSDSQGKAVPPTKRTLRPSEAALQERQQQQQQYHSPPQLSAHETDGPLPPHHRHDMYSQQPQQTHDLDQHHQLSTSTQHLYTHDLSAHAIHHASPPMRAGLRASSSSSSSRSPTSPTANDSISGSRRRASEPNPEVRRELLLIFFSKVQPWSCILDEISLLRDLSSMSASPAILFAIYALSARYAVRNDHVDVRYARLVEEIGNGTAYATEAYRALQSEDPATGMSALDGNVSLDTRQALCLLACFEFENGRHERAASYVQQCSKQVTSLRGNALKDRDTMEAKQRRQLSDRLTTVVAVLDVCINISCGRAPVLRAWELEMAVKSHHSTSVRPSSNNGAVSGQEQLSVALSHLLTITSVLSNALDIHRRAKHGANDETLRQVQACERYLQGWADTLPDRLRFDEENLYAVGQALYAHHHDNFGAAHEGGKSGPWSSQVALTWCAIHLFAESVTLLLRDALEAEVPLAAAQNMIMMLERMNVKLLAGPVVALAIAILKASSTTYKADRACQDGGLVSAWFELYGTTDDLQREARLGRSNVREAITWLSMGSAVTADDPASSLLSAPAHEKTGHRHPTRVSSPPSRKTVANDRRCAEGEAEGAEQPAVPVSSTASSSSTGRDPTDRAMGSQHATSVSPRQASSSLGSVGMSTVPQLESRQGSSSSTTDSSSSVTTLPTPRLYHHHSNASFGGKANTTTTLPPLHPFSLDSNRRNWGTNAVTEARHRAAALTSPRALLEQSRA